VDPQRSVIPRNPLKEFAPELVFKGMTSMVFAIGRAAGSRRLLAASVYLACAAAMADAQSAGAPIPLAYSSERRFFPGHAHPGGQPLLHLEELGDIAERLLQQNNLPLRVTIVIDEIPAAALARISGPPENATVTVQAWAVSRFSANTWAFVIGHEFAHRTDPRATRAPGRTHEDVEIAAEIIGARYAIRAGFDLDAHLNQLFHGPDGRGRAQGFTLQKAIALRKAFGR